MHQYRSYPHAALLAAVTALLLMTCRSDTVVDPSQVMQPAQPGAPAGVVTGEVLVGAGNIARCDGTGDEATAGLLDTIPGTVFTLGDNARPRGSTTDFTNCYGPSWGRHKGRTRPAAGDYDYKTTGGSGYFGYFGAAAGDPARGYYSYDLGAWHIIVLNSNISTAVGSAQEQWLRDDLAGNSQQCTLAYWHHPRFSSYGTKVRASVKPLWDALYAAGADVVLNANYLLYERFAPQTPDEVADPTNGIRQFTVGTGGDGLDQINPDNSRPNSEVHNDDTYGVLKLTLSSDGYAWEFVPTAGQTFTDIGSDNCHQARRAASVEVTPTSSTVEVGNTAQLTATLRDAEGNPIVRPVTWSASNPAVATVSGAGLVTGVSSGSTTITAISDGVAGSGDVSVIPAVPPPPGPPVLVGAGDIASCDTQGDEATATLLDGIQGTVFTLGDNAYPDGTAADFTNCYHPSWGRHKARTRPVAGNHEYNTSGATGYFGYFGAAAGEPGKGYYSYDVGEWHVIVLNDNINVSTGSLQEQWLRADLAANNRQCTLAMWHQPRFTSVLDRITSARVKPLWDALYQAGADLIVNAHDHSYERFAPQRPDGTADPTFGIRQITVGTGGQSLYDFGTIAPNSQARNNTSRGVLKLTLNSGSYAWEFIPVAGQTFTDSGTGNCHAAPGSANQAPQSSPGGPYTGNEGGLVAFNGGGSSDSDGDLPLTYAWNFGDGSTGAGVSPGHAYPSNGSYSVSLTVTDSRGGSNAATTTATIANVAPTVNAGQDATLALGEVLSISAEFSDPGANDAPWAYSINWGDGATTTGSLASQATPLVAGHTFAATGQYSVRVTITDKDGGADSDELVATVTALPPPNQPPDADPGGPYAGSEGSPVALTGSGSSDPDNNTPFTYAWGFGDGTTGTGPSPTHAYQQNGAYTVTLTVTDSRGLAGSPATTTATIANAPPAVNAGADVSLGVGAALNLSASFADPGANDAPWSYLIAWGDGGTDNGSVSGQAAPIGATHSYASPGVYTVSMTVTDKDGGTGADQLVANVVAAGAGQVVAAAGNIARCSNTRHHATAALIDGISGPVTVLPLGDNAYSSGTLSEYVTCYGPSWGRFLGQTFATLGNREYATPGAAGAFEYFGTRIGPAGKGYYSFDLGDWHVIVLNTNGGTAVPYTAGSEQEQWLRADLAASQKLCTMAVFHEPRFFSSSIAGWTSSSKPKVLWDALYAAGADVVLNGQMHHYERFAPQTATGARDDARGIVEFNVGVGGESVAMPTVIANNSAARGDHYGILKLTLSPTGYSWEFLPIPGLTFTDSGSGSCH